MTSASPGRRSFLAPLVALAAVVYPPLLLTEPGSVVADTKSYLYLDPSRLLSRAISMWDPHIGLGTVPHQQIGYLWPTGPYYWLMEAVGAPDWVAQRLWLGTIMVAAGAGVLFLGRTWRWRPEAAAAAAFIYALTPYVLTLGARLSVILLPFAGLPWLLALTIRALRTRGWRHPAAFALVVATVGGVNATALLLVGIVPVGWIIYSFWTSDEVTRTHAVTTLTKMGLLTLGVNLWWISGLSVQATNGINVLRYTETAEVVANSSTAPEVLRGLGYWFFYGGDRLGAWIEPSVDYTQSLWLIALSYAIPIAGLLGLGISRWRHRAFVILVLAAGTVIAVGAYPWDDPSPVGSAIKLFLSADIGLAMRSLPRAVPLVVLAIALGVGSLVAASAQQATRRGLIASVVVAVVAVAALPPLWRGQFVPENLTRPEDIPDYWQDATTALDADPDTTRVLEIPGIDFASYRWGNTVDPITPGLMDRPYVARELIPYGSAASADLLNALDRRLQERTFDPVALAPVARLMGVGDVVTRNDLQYERYNTPRPRTVWDLVRRAPGLGVPDTFGPSTPNIPTDEAPLLDEEHLVHDAKLPDPPAVGAFPVIDPQTIVRTHDADRAVLLSGDGNGIVDAAGAGLLRGDELVRYSANVTADPGFVRDHLRGERALVVTDTNRARGERWTTIRHTRGYTEQVDGGLLAEDVSDNRLPVFDERPGIQTVAEHVGVSARATSYGNPITYTPEDRPMNAVDGDPTTAWRTAAFGDARGQRIEVSPDDGVTTDQVTLLQPTTREMNRWITEVELRFDGGDPIRVALDERSRSTPGQVVDFEPRTFETLSVEIVADTAGERPGYGELTAVGFAEIAVQGQTGAEYIRMPQDLLDAGGYRSLRYPLALVQSRERSSPTDTTRFDEELSMARVVGLPTARDYRLTGTARLSSRAPTTVLDQLLGRPAPGEGPSATATSTLPGGLSHLPANVLDGDTATRWTSAFGAATGQQLQLALPSSPEISSLTVTVVDDAEHSLPTSVAVETGDGTVIAEVDTDGAAVDGTRTVTLAFDAPARSDELTVSFPTVDERTTTDWSSDAPESLPVAVAEVDVPGVEIGAAAGLFDTGCRNDLVEVDGVGIPVRITGTVDDALAGDGLDLRSCDDAPLTIPGGDHHFDTAEGRATGLDIDQLVWCSAGGGAPCSAPGPLLPTDPSGDDGPDVTVAQQDDTTVRVEVSGAEPGEAFWLVLGQSYNDGWQITDEAIEHEPTQLVDGYANGFLVMPDAGSFEVEMRFTPQNRVEIGLFLSLLGGLFALGLAVARSRSIRPVPIPLQEPLRRIRASTWEGALPTRRNAVVVGIGAGVGAFAVTNPLIGVTVGLLAGFATRREGWRPLFTVLPAGLLAICALYVIAFQYRNALGPGLHWPMDTGRLHTVGLAAVVLLVVDVAIDHTWARRSEFR